MKDKTKKVFRLFLTFLKIGAFTFGGGYAMIPLIRKEAVEKNSWITDDELLEVTAIAESTPGPIAVNSATFVGYRVAGFAGALAATVGVITPSFTIIYLLSFAIEKFESNTTVKYAFTGIRAGVLALIIKALWSMGGKIEKNVAAIIIMIAAFIIAAFTDINVLYIIIVSAAIGIINSLITARRKKNDDIS